jgi:hypothetical protein
MFLFEPGSQIYKLTLTLALVTGIAFVRIAKHENRLFMQTPRITLYFE